MESQLITLRAAELEKDFGQLAAWFGLLEEAPLSEPELKDYYLRRQAVITARVAEGARGSLLGFSWLNVARPALCPFDLLVRPESRGQGVGRHLFADLLSAAQHAGAARLRTNVADSDPASREFLERRGFNERWHFIPMRLDLDSFDDRPYDALIARLKEQGFVFTSMEALGDSEDAQRRLFDLNLSTDLDVPGRQGEPSWDSFEDFRERVCRTDWYRPGGQMVVIDSTTGEWAAMSAITRFGDHAYNLHTGVDRKYRGRKLAQAVKVHALRYARDFLDVHIVLTHHNTTNAPIMAIDRKFGYQALPGTFVMEKTLITE